MERGAEPSADTETNIMVDFEAKQWEEGREGRRLGIGGEHCPRCSCRITQVR